MKKETSYRKKLKALLGGLSKYRSSAERHDDDLLRLVVSSILLEDTSREQAEKALAALEEEFVDYNELRVALPREVGERMGSNYPDARTKAETIKLTLKNIFDRFNRLSLDSLAEVPKRDLPRRLEELGLSPYAGCCVAMFGFDIPGLPVDDSLAGCLELNGCVEPGSSTAEVRAFLDKVIAREDAPAAHEFFTRYVEKNAKALAKKRAAEAKARAEAEAKAKAEAEAAMAAEARKAEKDKRKKAAARGARKGRPREAAKAAKGARKTARAPKSAKKAAKARRSRRRGAGLKKKRPARSTGARGVAKK